MRASRPAVLLLATALALTACGGDDDTTESDEATGAEETAGSDETTGAEQTGADEATDGGTAAPTGDGGGDGCTLDEPVTVGVVFSQTEGAAVYGSSQLAAVELAAEELNAEGGVTYELAVEDDASDPTQGITAFERLINQEGVSVIIGPTLSNTAFSTNPIAQEAGIPVLGVSNTAEGITDIGDYIFRDSLTEGQVIPQTIEQSKAEFGLEQVAVLYGDDDAFTESGYQVFVEALESNEIEVTDTQTFAKGDTDFSAQLTAARQTEPDALVVSALAEEASLILTQAADLGLDVPVIGGNGFNSPAMIENAGDAAEGVVVGAAWNSSAEDNTSQEFITTFEDAAGESPDQFAAQAHAGMNIIGEAVATACSSDPTEIRDAMAGISGLPTVLGDFSFTDNRDADHPAVVQIVQDGAFAVLGQ